MAASFADAQQSILALNTDDLPFVYQPTPDGVVAHWKFGDVKWHNYIAAGQADAEYELRVVLDPEKETWTFHEKSSQSEASIGPKGLRASKSWHSGPQKSVNFSFGLAAKTEQTDRHGTKEGHIYSWEFTSDEVKAPVTQALEAAGWSSGNGFFSRLFGG